MWGGKWDAGGRKGRTRVEMNCEELIGSSTFVNSPVSKHWWRP